MMTVLRAGCMAAAALAAPQAATAAIITPSAPAGWGSTIYGGAISAITTTYPRSGSGSIEITLPSGTAGADWWVELATPAPLSTFSGGTYEWWRDSASTNDPIQAPAYALWIDNDCNTATTGDQTYLVYEPYYQTNANAPVNQWVGETVTPASVVWQAGGGVPWSAQPISAYMNGTATGGTAINGASCIVGVLPFAGSGWTGSFHGAMDNVTLTLAGAGQVVNANFEPDGAIAPGAGTVAVPTVGAWALGLMTLALGLLGGRRKAAQRATD